MSSQDSSEKRHRPSKEALSIKANLHLVNRDSQCLFCERAAHMLVLRGEDPFTSKDARGFLKVVLQDDLRTDSNETLTQKPSSGVNALSSGSIHIQASA